MNNYVALHNHSHFSLLDGLSTPKGIVDRAVELKMPAISITDHGSISAIKIFHDYALKKGIKPIIGVELYQCQQDPTIKSKENRRNNHLIILAKNPQGIKELFDLISLTNSPDFFYYKPRIDLEHLKPFGKTGNLICSSACIGGVLPSSLFTDFKQACKVSTLTNDILEVQKYLHDDWQTVGSTIVQDFVKIFGQDNYFLEVQQEGMAIQEVITQCLRELSQKCGIPTVATLDAHYLREEDASDHRILLYSQMKTNSEKIEQLKQSGEDTMAFFHCDEFFVYDYDKMLQWATPEELQRTVEIADSIDVESLNRKPCLPSYKSEKDATKNSNAILYDACICGAKKILGHLSVEEKRIYWERLQYELEVIKEAGLADYFLIVQDACQWVDTNDGVRGDGRGSGAGCLINYLLDITRIDPLKYGLLFERFYNKGRNTKDRVALPDIDTDVNVEIRDKLINYLRDKWGHDHVAQMVTFSRLQGRAVLKEVFKARQQDVISIMKKHGAEGEINPFEVCNEITKLIPNEAEISDDLQIIREETGQDDYGILQWTIDHIDEMKQHYEKFKPLFDQAMRLEGVKKSQGRHAAGLVIASQPIAHLVPMVYDPRSKEQIVGLEMNDAEGLGCVKFDFLGIASLDKLQRIQDLVHGKADELEAKIIEDYLEENHE